jgi:hypothetical protein
LLSNKLEVDTWTWFCPSLELEEADATGEAMLGLGVRDGESVVGVVGVDLVASSPPPKPRILSRTFWRGCGLETPERGGLDACTSL